MKNLALRSRQRGLSFIGLVFLVAIIVAVAAIGAQSVPVFLEYQAITKAANKAAAEGSSVAEVKASFDRSAFAFFKCYNSIIHKVPFLNLIQTDLK